MTNDPRPLARVALAALALLALGSGCALADYLHLRGSPQRTAFDRSLPEVWPLVAGYFDKQGLKVQNDRVHFVLQTDWQERFAGSKQAVTWERFTVMGKPLGEGRSQLWVLRTTLSANPALAEPGGLARFGRSLRPRSGNTNAEGNVGESAAVSDVDRALEEMEVLSRPAGDTGLVAESARTGRDSEEERKLFEYVKPELARAPKMTKAAVAAALREPPPTPAALARCGENVAGLRRLAGPGAVLLLGEGVHGTEEAPRFVGRLACHLASAGVPVTVVVEVPVRLQGSLDDFMDSDGGPYAQQALVATPFWRTPYPDGRSSEAMAHLLEELRTLRAGGLDVALLAYDHPQLQGDAREEAMAQRLLGVVEGVPGRATVVLTGNLHARIAKGGTWGPEAQSVGYRLAQALPRVTSLDMAYATGAAWICAPTRSGDPTRPDCGVKPAKGRITGTLPFVRTFDEVSGDGFHGYFFVGQVHPSPPAVRTVKQAAESAQ